MIVNGKNVVSYMRLSPTFIVVGLEGNDLYRIEGDQPYVDQQERVIREALQVNNTNPASVLNALLGPTGHKQEPLGLPVYNYGPKDKSVPVQNCPPKPGDRQPALPTPVYNAEGYRRAADRMAGKIAS